MSQAIIKDGWRLVDSEGYLVREGNQFKTSRGATLVVTGGRPPLHSGSTGRVWVTEDGKSREYFPNVIDCKWEQVS